MSKVEEFKISNLDTCYLILTTQLATYNLGGLAQGSHLFPSRTEKLSPAAPMVLGLHPGE